METRNQVGQSLRGDLARLQRLLANEVFADAGDARLVRPGYFRVLKSGCRGLRNRTRFQRAAARRTRPPAPPPGIPFPDTPGAGALRRILRRRRTGDAVFLVARGHLKRKRDPPEVMWNGDAQLMAHFREDEAEQNLWGTGSARLAAANLAGQPGKDRHERRHERWRNEAAALNAAGLAESVAEAGRRSAAPRLPDSLEELPL